MNLFISIILLLLIGVMGYYFINKFGQILDNNSDSIDNENRTNLIHLGFSEPYLAEDFIGKMDENDNNKHSMELIVYSGTNDDIMNMLLAGELDYVIVSNFNSNIEMSKLIHKEIMLKPGKLRTSADDIIIEAVNNSSMKVIAFWVPRWINKEKEYFSDLIMKLD